MEDEQEHGSALPSSETEDGSEGRRDRMRAIVRFLGGNREAVRKTGVPLSTLGGYISGGEMKLSNAVAIARAAGIRLDWLATGEGPMREDVAPTVVAGGVPQRQEIAGSAARSGLDEPAHIGGDSAGLGIAWQVNPDRLAQAYEMALNGFAVTPGRRPDAKRLMQVTLIMYDDLTEAEEAAKSDSKPL